MSWRWRRKEKVAAATKAAPRELSRDTEEYLSQLSDTLIAMSWVTNAIHDLHNAMNMHFYRHYTRGEDCDQVCMPPEIQRYLATLSQGRRNLLLIVLLKDWVVRVNLEHDPG